MEQAQGKKITCTRDNNEQNLFYGSLEMVDAKKKYKNNEKNKVYTIPQKF
jgi:hypothetical protein